MKQLFGYMVLLVVMMASLAHAQAPANDECAGAFTVIAIPFADTENTRLATPNPSDPPLLCAAGGGGRTVWFKYTADTARWLSFNTIGSTPSAYDQAMGLYIGSCGSLVQIACNDDIVSGVIRQSEIYYFVDPGTTYYVQVAEWKQGYQNGTGGGDLIFNIVAKVPPPLFKGPKDATLASGGSVSTNGFSLAMTAETEFEWQENRVAAENEDVPPMKSTKGPLVPPKAPYGSNYKEFRHINYVESNPSRPVALKSFDGIPATGYIPPDPILAVGPNQIVACVNSSFRIYDKEGTILKTISAAQWFANVQPGNGPSDPQVIYDHFDHRWVMTWLDVNSPYHILLAVSDDDNPLGTWYNWSLPCRLGDSTRNNLSDYPGLGFDDQALYIASNEYNPGFQYSKLRIIGKAQLYANTGGPVAYRDLWDFRDPEELGVTIFRLRAAITFGTPGTEFLLNPSGFDPGTHFTLWKLVNPLSTLGLTAVDIPVVEYYGAPNASQLGGDSLSFETAGSGMLHQPVYRDSSLWAVHSVGSDSTERYSNVSYLRINPFTNTNLEDVSQGMAGYWHFYPNIMVDSLGNVIVSYTRSSNSEYAGAFAAGKRAADPPGLSVETALKLGEAHYEVDFGGGRNRWGDYNGTALDPSEPTAIWALTEYAGSPSDNWKTWVSKMKMAPVVGTYVNADTTALTFPFQEVGTTSDTARFNVSNYGLDSLTITQISFPDTNFAVVSHDPFPITLPSFGSTRIGVVFAPKALGSINSGVLITSNDTYRPSYSLPVTGRSFAIAQVQSGTIYTSEQGVPGHLRTLNSLTGALTDLGPTDYTQITHIRINPATHELMGVSQSGGANALLRINAAGGDAHPRAAIRLTQITGMAFHGDTLFVARINGDIFRINTLTGDTTLLSNCRIHVSAMDFHPQTGELWVGGQPYTGGALDNVFKVNPYTGASTFVGSTGFHTNTSEFVFDKEGNLYGLVVQPLSSAFIAINTQSASGSLLATINSTTIQSIAFDTSTSIFVVDFSFSPGWNLFSIPTAGSIPDLSHLLPAAQSSPFSFTGSYAPVSSLQSGVGYWVKFGAPKFSAYTGSPLLLDSIPLAARWNLIGTIGTEVRSSTFSSEPPGIVATNFFSYQSGGYVPVDTLAPGKGYWVRASGAGTLVMNSAFAIQQKPQVSLSVQEIVKQLNSLSFTSTSGGAQKLYFGSVDADGVDPARFEMPPAFPNSDFDVRFSSQRMAEMFASKIGSPLEFPISLVSAAGSVDVRWHISDASSMQYSLVMVDRSSSRSSITTLSGEGSATLSLGKASALSLHVNQHQVPSKFVLHQNYPNPFNPATTIRYEIPVSSFVQLVVFDALGQEVATLIQQQQDAGYYELPLHGDNWASGIYFYRLTAGSFTDVQKMVLLK